MPRVAGSHLGPYEVVAIAQRPAGGGAEQIIFGLPGYGRILAVVTSEARASRPLTLVQNWTR